MHVREETEGKPAAKKSGGTMSKRAERIPVGVQVSRLSRDPLPGMQQRWVKDDGNRIERFLQGGWVFVQKDQSVAESMDHNKVVKDVADKTSNPPRYHYLMAIDEELYREDQRAKQRMLDERENELRRQSIEPGSHQYTKPENIDF